MIRHAKLLLIALLVAFGAASIADAAPKKVVHRRARHSTRVSAGAAAPAAKTAHAPRARATKKRTGPTASRPAARKSTAAGGAATAQRKPTTKPR
jgi:hypothetical protein